MPHAPHQTTPFRRPSNPWPQDVRPDPAEVGTAFGLELCLEGESGDPTASHPENAPGDGTKPSRAPTLCP